MAVKDSPGGWALTHTLEEYGYRVSVPQEGSKPHHIHAFADGMVRQQFTVCVACRLIGGVLAASDESHEVGFFSAPEMERLDMHLSIRRRIQDYLEGKRGVVG